MLSYLDVFWLLTFLSLLVAPIPLFICKPKAAPTKEPSRAE